MIVVMKRSGRKRMVSIAVSGTVGRRLVVPRLEPGGEFGGEMAPASGGALLERDVSRIT